MPVAGQIKRADERHNIDLDIAVAMLDGATPVSGESSVLKNISGGGLCFISNDPALYSVGERVALDINLSGKNPNASRARGTGTIVWIGAEDDKKGWACIGVSMDDLVSMERFVHE
jgi:Tfp pilus assembly protein PilZ